MQLFYSTGSPYARKVRVCLREVGLRERVVETIVNPHDNTAELLALNPLAKVPVLSCDTGPLIDSPLICEYLDGLTAAAPLVPAQGAARMAVLQHQALADGMMDAAVASVLESRRADTQPSAHWLRRWQAAIERTVDVLAQAPLPTDVRLDGIAAACALAYLDYRHPSLAWRSTHPPLAAWLDRYTDRDSFRETAPR